MPPWLAWFFILFTSLSGISWTIYVHLRGWPEKITTSHTLWWIFDLSPQLYFVFGSIALLLLFDALPNTNRWLLFFGVFIPLYAFGHCSWPLTGYK